MSITNILVTGANGFVGRNLCAHLARRDGLTLFRIDVDSAPDELDRAIESAEIIFHLAGVNRPKDPGEFQSGNAGFTEDLCDNISKAGRKPLLVLSSSIQAALENSYGISKRGAEDAVKDWAERGGGKAIIFRLKNVFGKWCRPNYNSVTATFCHNTAHDLPITINDPDKELDLVYIDDVVEAFVRVVEQGQDRGQRTEDRGQREGDAAGERLGSSSPCLLPLATPPLPLAPCPLAPAPLPPGPWEYREVERSYRITLGELAARIRSFREMRRTLVLPDLGDPLNRCLYATYLSYLDGPDFAYRLDQKTDPRGSLAEFVKSAAAGQIFVSRTKPGITRGNHYHHTKTEKFLVLEGEAIIRFRRVEEQGAGSREQGAEICGRYRTEHPGSSTSQAASTLPEFPAPGSGLRAPRSELAAAVIEHRVSGRDFVVVDIPPGYTHSIENVGSGELVTLFWASEPFDPQRPDTYGMEVGR
ncbi:MAG TPA: NAD-dependent epimerase/dehydratase family protein [Verrucomicrobiota bacterium]|jgi:UDP-2-acetamido-2,6-beta-L-arabino-hexul-4-ose reductase|nr:SDR family oxidoreductase [Verrucomicrobiota bacterium]HPW80932.1 NAD-dependent epimerase/dehydratase family protein [Verrucomicrobiota bacterium]